MSQVQSNLLPKQTITSIDVYKQLTASQAGLSSALNSMRIGTRSRQDVEKRLEELDKFIIKFQQENRL